MKRKITSFCLSFPFFSVVCPPTRGARNGKLGRVGISGQLRAVHLCGDRHGAKLLDLSFGEINLVHSLPNALHIDLARRNYVLDKLPKSRVD